jgi:hypothetical protein
MKKLEEVMEKVFVNHMVRRGDGGSFSNHMVHQEVTKQIRR